MSVPVPDFVLEPEPDPDSPEDDFGLYSKPNAFERFSITLLELGGDFDEEVLELSRGTWEDFEALGWFVKGEGIAAG